MSLKQAAQRELIWRRCAKDPIFAFESFFFIQHPQGRRLFKLREPQRDAVLKWLGGGNWLTLKARQIGWSTLVAAFVLWMAIFHDDRRILIISKGEREAQELLKKVKFAWNRLPPWMRERAPKLTNDNLQNMAFSNGSEIISVPSAADPARGFSGSLVIVDEWAFLPNAEEAWASIEPVADIGGQIIGLSTANGSGNFFHQLWVNAEEGANSFKTMFYSWRAVPERDDAWFEAKCREMNSWQRAQEYPSDPEEAFIKSGNPVFGDVLDGLRPQSPKAIGHLRRLEHGALEFRGEGGPLSIWEYPDPSKVYVVGADTAEGLAHGDYSSAHVIDVATGHEVAHWHGHIDADEFGTVLYDLGYYYNRALVCPEANNHGLTTITALRRLGYPSIYRRRQLNSANQNMTVQFGWLTTRTSKPLLIDDLNMAMKNAEIDIRSAATIKELRTYVRDEKGHTHGSPYDDRVISLALANQMRKFAHVPEAYGDDKPKGWTLDWWISETENERKGETWTIGGGRRR
jgi:hypothetical protein